MNEARERSAAGGFVAVGGPAAFDRVCRAATHALGSAFVRLVLSRLHHLLRSAPYAEWAAQAAAVLMHSLATGLMMTPGQAAERLGVSLSLIYQLCASRRLPHYRIGGEGRRGKVVIDEKDLDAFLAGCRVTDDPLMDESDLKHIR